MTKTNTSLTFSNALFSMKRFVVDFDFRLSLLLRVQLIVVIGLDYALLANRQQIVISTNENDDEYIYIYIYIAV